MYLLDTNVVSEIRKAESRRADPQVVAWVDRLDTGAAYISVITIQELERGVLLTERRDPFTGSVLRNWLDNDVFEAFANRILSVDTEVARIAAGLHVPDPAPVADALIAATALAHRMTIVTRNTGDFKRFPGLKVLNPWNPTTMDRL